MKKNVLSLFDGMSCLRMALEKTNIEIENYYASEIDKHAIGCTKYVFPDTVHIGSVVDIDVFKLPKIDILAGGSPCQSFSFAGKMKGMATKDEVEILTLSHYLELKSKGYEFEGQSYLFWEYMRILKDIQSYNPDVVFLLENVVMSEKWEKILTKAIGVNPIEINSALVSAQNRRRLYWTNIGMQPMGLFGDLASIIQQPKDKGILLKDILERDVSEKYYLSDKMLDWLTKHSEKRGTEFKKLHGGQKASCLTTTEAKQNLSNDYIVHNTMPRSSKSGKGGTGSLSRTDGKTYCLDTGKTNAVEIQCVAMRGREACNIETQRKNIQQLEPRTDGKTNTLASVQKDNLVMQLNPSIESGGNQPYQQNRVYDTNGISPCLNTDTRAHAIKHERNIRRLTPRECGRLQTVSENYIDKMIESGTSDTQLYRMYGNGWTIDVIAHILSYLKK